MVVVGGGVIGCAIALELARRGVTVTLLERLTIASGASFGAGGMLAPQVEAEGPGPLLDLGMSSRDLFPSFCATLDDGCGLHMDGILRVASTEGSAAALRARAEWQGRAGLTVRICDAQECAAQAPGVADAVLGLWVPDGQVDAYRFTLALAQAAAQSGVDIREGTPALRVLDGRVETAEGRLEAQTVVVAAGAWSGRLVEIPVVPLKGQRLLLRHTRANLPQVLWTDHCYLVPKAGGRVLVGATEEPQAGFDRRVTAAAMARLAGAAIASLPAFADAEWEEGWAGLRPTTPDHLPVLGWLPGSARTMLATGHHRNGILLAPLTAQRIAQAIVDGASLPQACAPERFTVRNEVG